MRTLVMVSKQDPMDSARMANNAMRRVDRDFYKTLKDVIHNRITNRREPSLLAPDG